MDLSARVRSAIAALGQTQSWVAVRANVPEETISRIVTGDTKNPQVGTLLKIAPVLGVTVGWLLGEKNAPFTNAESAALARAIEILRGRIGGGSAEPRTNAVPLADEPVPREYHARGARLVFQAQGDSMRSNGILDGDRLFVRPASDVRQAIDEIAVCRVDGSLHARRLRISGGRIVLASDDERIEPLLIDERAGDFALLGVVVARAGAV